MSVSRSRYRSRALPHTVHCVTRKIAEHMGCARSPATRTHSLDCSHHANITSCAIAGCANKYLSSDSRLNFSTQLKAYYHFPDLTQFTLLTRSAASSVEYNFCSFLVWHGSVQLIFPVCSVSFMRYFLPHKVDFLFGLEYEEELSFILKNSGFLCRFKKMRAICPRCHQEHMALAQLVTAAGAALFHEKLDRQKKYKS